MAVDVEQSYKASKLQEHSVEYLMVVVAEIESTWRWAREGSIKS